MKVIPKSKKLEEKLMAELDFEKLSIDPATQQMLKKAKADGCETIWDRAAAMTAFQRARDLAIAQHHEGPLAEMEALLSELS